MSAGTQLPTVPGWAQDQQEAEQSCAQQTPSKQKPVAHSAPAAQACPSTPGPTGRSGAASTTQPPEAQSAPASASGRSTEINAGDLPHDATDPTQITTMNAAQAAR